MKTSHFALPNVLAGEALVPELIQDEATPERIAAEDGACSRMTRRARAARRPLRIELHEHAAPGADRRAAEVVLRWRAPAGAAGVSAPAAVRRGASPAWTRRGAGRWPARWSPRP
jgi:lipid-A-disaccharide synthase